MAYGLTLVNPSLHGWETFPLPGALTYTRITWVLLPTAPQVLGVTPGSPFMPMVVWALLMERCVIFLHVSHICQKSLKPNSSLHAMAMYFTFIVDNAMVGCFLHFHEIIPTPTKKTHTLLWIANRLYLLSNSHRKIFSKQYPSLQII